jgi:hypothetical protein
MAGSVSGGPGYLLALSSPVVAALQDFIKESGISSCLIVDGAWAILLHRYGGEDDAVFGVYREHEVAGDSMGGATPLPQAVISRPLPPVRMRIGVGVTDYH